MQAAVLASLSLAILEPAGILEVAGVPGEGWLWEGKRHLKAPTWTAQVARKGPVAHLQ